MILQSPEWFYLVPVLALVGWRWRRLQLWLPLRVLILLIVVITLANPRISKLKEGLDLWVLFDRSASTEDMIDVNIVEWKKLLEDSKPSETDELIYVDFASEVLEQSRSDGAVYSGSRALTRTALALESTLAKLKQDKPARILLFSDGFSTEPIGDLATKLSAQGVPLDYRMVREEVGRDYRVRRLQLPGRVQIAEPFLLEVEVTGRPDGKVPATLSRSGQTLTQAEIEIIDGRGMLRFTDRITQAGAYKYEVLINPENDTHLGNNMREAWIEVTGGPRVLLLTKYLNDPVEAALTKQGFEVRTSTIPNDPLNMGLLSGCRAVIINNVPAFELPNEFLRAMKFFVREQGGGFLMAGGKQSFGAGGYFRSAVDDVLILCL